MSVRFIRLLLADDHRIVREGIRSTLQSYPHIQIVGEVCNGVEAVERACQLKPDVVLMDINMPVMNGIEAMKHLRQRANGVKVIALTMHDSKEYVVKFIRSGANGYVLKDTSPEDLVRAIESVFEGDAFFSPSISRFLLEEIKETVPRENSTLMELSRREIEVLRLIAQGYSNKEIARHLNLGVRTIESHRERVMRKLSIRSVAGLTRFALDQGLLS
jgi:two-component system, NarL family, nitrate/nitrite response regulator NarL